jgi:hypothetical protein
MKGLINNEWDRDNLEFLMRSGDTELAQWYAQADADDLEYAQELFAAYSRELDLRSQDLVIEAKLAQGNYHEANMVIDKFTK